MSLFLRQSTASQEVLLGPFVDSTDGVTAKTALTIANTDIKIWVAGATTLASKNSGGGTHIATGNYYAVLDATDTATVGSGAIVVQVSGALAFRMPFTILAAQVYDSLIAATDNLDVNVEDWGNTAVPTTEAGGPFVIRRNTATGGAAGSLTLDASASAVDDFYNGGFLELIGGTGIGQGRTIADYTGATKVAAVDRNWITTPDNTSVFRISAGSLGTSTTEITDAMTAAVPSVNVARVVGVTLTGDGDATPFQPV